MKISYNYDISSYIGGITIKDENNNLKPRILLDHYKQDLDYDNMPEFLNKYLNLSILKRLKKVGYFCGMDYASKDIYDFREYISRYDHSLTVALLTWKFTHNKLATLAALFHDVSTPCFSHVIDYMNNDYEQMESIESYTETIMKKDKNLLKLLKNDKIELESISDFKKYSIVDTDRPKLCADRLDGIILTGISWTQSLNEKDIDYIIDNVKVYKNEDNEDELGFKNIEVTNLVMDTNRQIDEYCHTDEDFYMMELLAKITKSSIDKGIIKYEDLFIYTEDKLLRKLYSSNDKDIIELLNLFQNIKYEEIPNIKQKNVKVRVLTPLVDGKRLAA